MTDVRFSLLRSSTLNRYFAWMLFKTTIYIVLFCAVLILLIDFTEQLRRVSGRVDASALTIIGFSAYRTPAIIEQIFPFTILFSSMITFFMLSKRLELVVARGPGISVWQFLLPGIFVAFTIGIFTTTIFNPTVNYMNDQARLIEADIFNRDAKLLTGETSAAWLRKSGRSEDIILGAARALDNGTYLIGVTIIRQSRQGKLIQRVDADTAKLDGTQWLLTNATVTGLDTQRRSLNNYALKLDLTIEEVRDGFSKSDQRSFWSLPDLIEKAKTADLPTYRYSLQFNTLLAQPFFFIAIVVIAATVSLRFIRSGNVNGLIASGIAAGFTLFVLRSLAEDLGSSGVVQPVLAAWLPTLLALVLGFTVLLHQEDG
ncbi:MAG: LPS export ABC transporter permease LptG [Hyphomicrobiales bacterium]